MTLAQALERGALAAYWNGESRQAQQWADEAAALAVDGSEASAQVRHGVYFTRWQMYRSQGRHEDCYRVAQESVDDAQRVTGPARDSLLQRSLVRRGTSATDLLRYEAAERDLLEAVAMAQRLHGTTHAETLKAQQALGWHYVSRGQAQRGLQLLLLPLGSIRLEAEMIRTMVEYGVDGCLVAAAALTDEAFDAIAALRVPAVMINRSGGGRTSAVLLPSIA